MAGFGANGYALITAIPKQDPSNPAVGQTIDRLRTELPKGALVGGAVAENHDLQAALSAKTPLVIAVVMGLGFLLLLVALQAPLLAAVGVLTNLLATGAAFGVAKWIVQDGALHSLLGFQSQGFLDAWGPVFFFAMIFAISMDYTVFLLSAAKEHWDHTHNPREAMVGAVAHSGRVIFAAGAATADGLVSLCEDAGGPRISSRLQTAELLPLGPPLAAGLLGLGVFTPFSGWLLWGLVMGLGLSFHPPLAEAEPQLDGRRRMLAWVSLGMMILSFTPAPIVLLAG